MNTIVGIDLGTTHSLIGIFRDGKAELIPNALGEWLTPSAVSVDDDGSILVGRAAQERLITHPQQSAGAFKRFMGSQKTYQLGKHHFTPEALSALVLKSLKADAEAALGEKVRDAVITVPAYFNDQQRRATQQAAEMAGLNVRRLLNEPTAAAMAYGLHQKDADSQFLVLDLGGGTFDVTLLEMFDGIMEVRASTGDNALGGEDFTALLIEHFAKAHPALDAGAHRGLIHAAAEKAKRALGSDAQTEIAIHANGERLIAPVTAAEFTQMAATLLQRIREPVERAVRDSRVRLSRLDDIILVGGATRMPLIRQSLTRLLGRFPSVSLNPDETIALGAAIQAGLVARDAALAEVVMTDVAPYSLGVETSMEIEAGTYRDGLFAPIIERNTTIPASRMHTFYAIHAEQKHVDFEIYQGEARHVRDNIRLGSIRIDIPKGVKDASKVPLDVRFTYDVSGLLEVDIDVQGKRHNLVIHNQDSHLSDADIARIRAELEALKIHPRERQDIRTLMARGERLYMQHLGDTRAFLQNALAQFENALDTQHEQTIRHAMQELEKVLDAVERNDIW
ncbi:MAG: molecular chaperone HscC [Cardiobacteriaceae bacterium]|nr:molecular chaperone HscC [Cardiobacteriaceae bacterium]